MTPVPNNLYRYAKNAPTGFIDPQGTADVALGEAVFDTSVSLPLLLFRPGCFAVTVAANYIGRKSIDLGLAPFLGLPDPSDLRTAAQENLALAGDVILGGIACFVAPPALVAVSSFSVVGVSLMLETRAMSLAAGGARGAINKTVQLKGKNFFAQARSNAAKRTPWSLKGADRVLRHNDPKFGKFHRDPKTGFWWSTDKAGHGGSAFKVFKETKTGLEWIADADEFGDFIKGKHKGPTGLFIPFRQLFGV